MRVHHLNCATLNPAGGFLFDGRTQSLRRPATLVCHCLLVETNTGLVLVDTGLGLEDVRQPHPRLSRSLLALLRPRLLEPGTARRQVERLGYSAEDVRHVVLTHLDFDHAGGLDDFPEARVHLLAAEHAAALSQASALDRRRYRPRQWMSAPRWVPYPVGVGERWFGFECVRDLEGLPPELLLVPLAGTTLGHAGVAVDTGRGWLLHAGDAYFFREEMDPEHPRCTAGLAALQRLLQKDGWLRRQNQERLRALVRAHGDEVEVFCSHDAVEFERLEEAALAEADSLESVPLHLVPRPAPHPLHA